MFIPVGTDQQVIKLVSKDEQGTVRVETLMGVRVSVLPRIPRQSDAAEGSLTDGTNGIVYTSDGCSEAVDGVIKGPREKAKRRIDSSTLYTNIISIEQIVRLYVHRIVVTCTCTRSRTDRIQMK